MPAAGVALNFQSGSVRGANRGSQVQFHSLKGKPEMDRSRHVRQPGRASLFRLAGLLLLMPTASGAQQPDPPPADQQPAAQQPATGEESAAMTEWRTLTRQRRVLQDQLGAVLANFSLTNMENNDQHLAQVAGVKEQLGQLRVRLMEAAAAAYIEAPRGSFLVERDVQAYLRLLMGEDPSAPAFDPHRVLALTGQMFAAGCENAQIVRFALRAAIAAEDFPAAQANLALLKKLKAPIDEAFATRLAKLEADWQVELAARQRDEAAALPLVRFETGAGVIIAQLFEDDAPNTVNSFVNLVEKGFFDGQEYFLVDTGFLSVSGCPDGTGLGHAGYSIPTEADSERARKHFAGSLATFNSPGLPVSSQYTFVWQPIPERDGQATVFGRIVEGLDVLYKMPGFTASDRLAGATPLRLVKATMLQKREHAYAPQLTTPVAPPATESSPPSTTSPPTPGATPDAGKPGDTAVPAGNVPAANQPAGNPPPDSGGGGSPSPSGGA